MNTRFDAYLDGVSLSSLDEKIAVVDICESSPELKVSTMTNNMNGGNRLIRQTRNNLSVKIEFEVCEYDPTRRKQIISRIVEWANKGRWLKVSDRIDQRLSVRCSKFPTVDSSLKWLNRLSVTFTAYGMPYWISDSKKSRTYETSANVWINSQLVPLGNAEKCFVEVKVTNNSNTALQNLTLNVGETSIVLLNVNVPKNQSLQMYFDEDWIEHIECNGVSKMSTRRSDSADYLFMKTGRAENINFVTDTNCTVKFSVKGLYL